jgi:predicted phosphodiesterase
MTLNRLIAVTVFTVRAVVLCAAATVVDAEELEITHGPYLQHPAADGMTIVWHTNKKCVSKVEYGIGNVLTNTAISSHHGLIDNHKTSHIIRLTGLKPGTQYGYRVVSREFVGYRQQHLVTWGETVTGQTYRFTTLDPKKERFSFCVVADHHQREDELKAMMQEESWQGIEFAVYNGDMIGDFMDSEQMFTSFIDASVECFAANRPFIFVRGNHDMRGRYARNIPDFIPSFDGRSYFSFNHGPVHFIVLDTGEDKQDGHEYYNGLVDCDNYLKAETQWLKQDIESAGCRNATYRIVFCHIPLLPGGNYGTARAYKNFGSLLNEAKVDMALSGHLHRLRHVPPAGGKNAYDQIVAPPHATSRVDITENGIHVAIVQVGGKVLKTLSIPRR